jgi:hypothetical protein
MKVQILYDESDGKVMGIIHQPPEPMSAEGPTAFLRPQPGQKVVVLNVPAEFERLDSAHLHNAIRIDIHAETPRIVAMR